MTIDRAKSHILTEKSAGVWLFFYTEGKMYRETRNYENIQIMRSTYDRWYKKNRDNFASWYFGSSGKPK